MNNNLSLGDMNTLSGVEALKNNQLFSSGDDIGDYKVIRLLGVGGMGEVYLVLNVHINKQYALKVLKKEFTQRKNFIKNFKTEARLMADLKHPNIVSLLYFGEDKKRGIYYLVMEYVDSITNEELRISNVGANGICLTENPSDLESLLKNKKKLDEGYVLEITKQLCSALDYAHHFRGKGIVHRDLKPSNILLDTEGNAYISDFGLAKIIGMDYIKKCIKRSIGSMSTILNYGPKTVDTGPGTVDRKILSTNNHQPSTNDTAGALIGTYEYMAPEQQEKGEASVSSDIYSLGLIVYRMLTGCKAKGRFEMPSEFGCNKAWDVIIDRCLKLDPDKRFESAAEISNILNNEISDTSKKNRIWNRGWLIPGFIIIILVLVGGFYLYKTSLPVDVVPKDDIAVDIKKQTSFEVLQS